MTNTATTQSGFQLVTAGGTPVGTPQPTVGAAVTLAEATGVAEYLILPVTIVTVSAPISPPPPTAAPVLASFAPTSGAIGTPLTFLGSGLQGATAVKIGGMQFAPMGSTATSVSLLVPPGAQSGNVAVEVGGKWVFNNDVFTVVSAGTVPGAPTGVTAVAE